MHVKPNVAQVLIDRLLKIHGKDRAALSSLLVDV